MKWNHFLIQCILYSQVFITLSNFSDITSAYMHTQVQLLYRQFEAETQPFRKVHRMIDLFEVLIKSHTVVIMAEYFAHANISDAAKGLLAQGLRTPSLGTWQLFSRVLFQELAAIDHQWQILPMFPEEFSALDKALNAEKTNIIAFRNGYAHGATPTDEKCIADINQYVPFLQKLLNSQWLAESDLEIADSKVWLRSSTGTLCLHPLLVAKEEDTAAPFAFYNDLKNDKIGLLNYPLSKHYREKEFYTEFHKYLPLQEWKKAGNNEFFQRIEELTETFKGRIPEREQLLQFVRDNNKGYCSIQGNPGIGKSALIAQFFKDLRTHKEFADVRVIEYFIRRGTHQAQVEYLLNYLIKRTDELFAAGKEIRAKGKTIFDLQHQLFSKWRAWGEQVKGQKLLILIDGLDEGVENDIVSYLPRENFDNIIIIYGSRPGGHKSIDELWGALPATHHTKLELTGLGKEDIRALIYEVANKYEVERESSWIDAVQQRSQGNPLYLKLLCDAIEQGSIGINDINALPEKIDDYYKAILNRYASDPTDGDALLGGLFVFAAAKDYLTMAHLGLMNGLGHATVQRIGSTLKEVLYENPLTENVLDYQLFHESFREYLVRENAKQVADAAERIIDFCANWQQHDGCWEQRYALEHYATHLSSSAKAHRSAALLALMYDTAYTATQKKVLKRFDVTKTLYELCLLKATAQQQYDAQLEAALCLVDLKYEEANDAPQVVALVADGDIDLALQRIESFGGADKEGVERRFLLYMLCLMELTLLGSKDKPWRRAAIEKILNHFDEHIPADTSLINWGDFFPSYLVFLMASDWAEIGVDYLRVYKRTESWNVKWILEKGPYTDLQFEVLRQTALQISDTDTLNVGLRYISSELAKQGKFDNAIILARAISRDREINEKGKMLNLKGDAIADYALSYISSELARQGKFDYAMSLTSDIVEIEKKILALCAIFSELSKRGKLEEADCTIQEALSEAREIKDNLKRIRALSAISSEMANQGKLEEANCTIQEVLSDARNEKDDWVRIGGLQTISFELAKQGKIQDALSVAMDVADGAHNYSDLLMEISFELAKQGKMNEALSAAMGISEVGFKSSAQSAIAYELSKKQKFEQALSVARDISDDVKKSTTLNKISSEMSKQEKNEEAISIIQETYLIATKMRNDFSKSFTLSGIASELEKQGANQYANEISNEAINCICNSEITLGVHTTEVSMALLPLVKSESARDYFRNINLKYFKRGVFIDLCCELANRFKIKDLKSLVFVFLECSKGISSFRVKSRLFGTLYIGLNKLRKRVENVESVKNHALDLAQNIIHPGDKNEALLFIHKQGRIERTLFNGSELDLYCKEKLLMLSNMVKRGQWELAEKIGTEISLIGHRQECWLKMGATLTNEDGQQNALKQVQNLQSREARLFYLKGWANEVAVTDTNDTCLQEALPFLVEDTESIEALLQKYAVNTVVLGAPAKAMQQRLNKTLNIQWVLDIVSKFPKEADTVGIRLSTNIEEWLHEITDEDDRAQIELWARQVARSKITEQEFGEKIQDML
jgi:hypothetical protein